MQCNAMQCNAMQCNAKQCNAGLYNTKQYKIIQCNAMQDYTSQDHTNQLTGTAQQLQLLQIYIIADHMQMLVFTLKTTSKTATRTASSSCSFEKIPLHLIPFSLILLELKTHCSGYVVFKTSANVFSFLDKNSLIKLLCFSRAVIVKF